MRRSRNQVQFILEAIYWIFVKCKKKSTKLHLKLNCLSASTQVYPLYYLDFLAIHQRYLCRKGYVTGYPELYDLKDLAH